MRIFMTFFPSVFHGAVASHTSDRMADRRFQPSPDYGGEKQQHVADLLLLVLPAKSLTIRTCCRVADFPDQSSHLAIPFPDG
jgi:hypothetical protein